MESNIKRVPLRLNLDNPEHREIWELMESLKPEFHTSKTSFILDAIRCYLEYVRHTDDPAFVQKFYAALNEKKKMQRKEQSRIYKERAKLKPLFEITDRLDQLEPAELAYQDGDDFFKEEHREYKAFRDKLSDQGYSYEDVKKLEAHYQSELARYRDLFKSINKELRICGELVDEVVAYDREQERQQAVKQEAPLEEELVPKRSGEQEDKVPSGPKNPWWIRSEPDHKVR